MKKIYAFLGLSGILLAFTCLYFLAAKRTVQLQINGEHLYLNSIDSSGGQTILPWQKEDGVVRFFLPSCADDKIYFDQISGQVFIDGQKADKWTGFSWETGKTYTIEAGGARQTVLFMKSENIPSIFLTTESGGMDAIHADKNHQETGTIAVLGENGAVQYSGSLASISGRGNSTWEEEKKPYSIVLDEKTALCGMNSGKSWKLLALYYEHDKIHSRLTYAMAQELGLFSTPNCAWVDLYCNGNYQGIYLLTESKKRNLDSDAQWLLEKTHKSRLSDTEEAASFTTEMGYLFQAEKTADGFLENVSDAAAYIQRIEDLIAAGDTAYREYLDLDSLARKFLLEKIVMNYDAMGASAYFVLDGEGRLSSGPAWDYDNSFATSGFFSYTSPIESVPDEMTGWFNVLYEDSQFRSYMTDAYRELLPWLKYMLEEGIDACAEEISASVSMDLERWGMARNRMYLYEEYDNYIRYLKFFLSRRLNYLNEIWEIDGASFQDPPVTGEIHTVTFQSEDGSVLETLQVPDGTCLEGLLPSLDKERFYSSWFYPGMDKDYSAFVPVYEDLTLCARERESDEENTDS